LRHSHPTKLYLALLHHPVKNKAGEQITAAITSIDLHDIARLAKTYGVVGFYVVTPLIDQQELAGKIVGHWTDGAGATYNPDRKEALSLIYIRDDLEQVLAEIRHREGAEARIVATSASNGRRPLGYRGFRKALDAADQPYLLVFGTAWGLTPDFMEKADFMLEPIKGNTGYNHLSVRSAASIILDRLLGQRE
jgi:hypothetical protein